MRIIGFIEDRYVIRIILTHLGLWLIRSRPPPKKHTSIETVSVIDGRMPFQPAPDFYGDPDCSWDAYIQL
jgi:hypothetical protein